MNRILKIRIILSRLLILIFHQPKITEKLAKREDKPATLEDLHTWLEKSGKGTLSTVEQDDMHLKGKL